MTSFNLNFLIASLLVSFYSFFLLLNGNARIRVIPMDSMPSKCRTIF